MVATTYVETTSWNEPYVDLLRQLHYDDVMAMTTVLLASVVYLTHGLLWNRPDPYRHQMFQRPQQLDGARKAEEQSRCLAERLDQAGADIAILWASQSGTAEAFAARLVKDLGRYFGANILLLDISDIDPASYAKLPQSKLAIFIASTFGEGDPSDNMHDAWAWLQQDPTVDLSNMQFIAFGLGNSNYKHYNHVIDVIDTKLQTRGAQALLSTGKADDATGSTEEDFIEWKERVFGLFQSELGYQLRDVSFEPSVQIVEDCSIDPIDTHSGQPQGKIGTSGDSRIYALPVVDTRELFQQTTDRNCIHMELDLNQHSQLKYKTGDYLSVWASNPVPAVDQLLQTLGLDSKKSTPIHIKSVDGTAVKVPTPTTYEAMLQSYLEICAPLSREHVTLIATFAPTKSARDFLLSISEDKAAYAKYLAGRYVNLGILLQTTCDQPGAWSQLPLSLIVEILPAMKPRSYSISSSSVVQPQHVAITAVVADQCFSGSDERIPGLVTNYLLGTTKVLQSREENRPIPHLHARVCKSNFKLPTLASAPIVMVGAGTGVAPFRAFIQERARLSTMGRSIGMTKLYFGCRNPAQDYLYAEDFKDWGKTLGKSFSLTPAFSRPSDGKKRYVQDAVADEADELLDLLIGQNAHFYICGSAAMARDVSDTVSRLIMTRKGWDEAQMKDFAEKQKRQRRWLQDVWG